MASLPDTLRLVADDAAHVAVCKSATTYVQHEVPCDGGFVRVTFVPTGAVDPLVELDATIARLRKAVGEEPKSAHLAAVETGPYR